MIGIQETDQWRRTLPGHLLSGDNWFFGVPVTDIVEGKPGHMLPYLRSGRAVFLVVLKTFDGRPPVGAQHRRDYGSAKRHDILKESIIDMQRGLDYLETRPELDRHKIAFWNNSTYPEGALIAALAPRYSADIFIGAAIFHSLRYVSPEVNPLHFLPHIRPPKLMLHGLYDDGHPPAFGEPLFALMREPKRRATFTGGHIPAPEVAVPLIKGFLDETLGPVRRTTR